MGRWGGGRKAMKDMGRGMEMDEEGNEGYKFVRDVRKEI